ncbi:hypothetical protein ARMGADRAFT_1037103 [Armillaria gallica]|uniref:Uncharacterized protein n=1 Tax=Armillaria gallica TaxID=47427 RepID=A0A2H3CMW6_ARMGA|nr:hypothetical protein ARMGADRAFT_1037103 [Armillaria gallica]
MPVYLLVDHKMIPHEFVRKVPLPNRNARRKRYHWIGLGVRQEGHEDGSLRFEPSQEDKAQERLLASEDVAFGSKSLSKDTKLICAPGIYGILTLEKASLLLSLFHERRRHEDNARPTRKDGDDDNAAESEGAARAFITSNGVQHSVQDLSRYSHLWSMVNSGK